MSIKETLNNDLKVAMLAGDKTLVTTLRGLKSAILYAEVAAGKKETGLADDDIISLFAKEAKKRQESADLYTQGGNAEKAAAEQAEKAVIEKYLPAQLSDDELKALTSQVIESAGGVTKETMGQVIGKVKAAAGAGADGARIASIVREQLQWYLLLLC